MTPRAAWPVIGIGLILAGLFLPDGWYDPIPSPDNLPRPELSGAVLFRISLLIEGVVFVGLGFRRSWYRRLAPEERPQFHGAPATEETVSRTAARWWVVAITILAAVLRVYGIDGELWLDEVNARLLYRDASPVQIFVSYVTSNNHLLYTLLVKLVVALLGEREWVMRLPAVIFGIATIPVMYRASRLVLSRWSSLAAAALLAVSYHHVFFSQNARAYSAYLLFSLTASFFLTRALQDDRLRAWAFYVATTLLNFSATLIAAFVFAAHLVAGAIAVLALMRVTKTIPRLVIRVAAVAAVTGFFGFQLYAAALPQMLIYMRLVYVDPAAGFAPLSWEFVRALAEGLSAGYGAGWVMAAAVPALAIGGAGFVSLLRRNWAFVLTLTLPGVLLGAFLILRALVISPRFFLLALPLGIMCGTRGLEIAFAIVAGRWVDRRRVTALATAAVVLMAAASLWSLRRYYAVPKQAFRASLVHIQSSRAPGDIIIVVHLAAGGYEFYAPKFGLRDGEDFFLVRTVERLDRVLAAHPGRRAIAVTTFPRALRLTVPDLADRIARDWVEERRFPATVGDGEVTVWIPRRR